MMSTKLNESQKIVCQLLATGMKTSDIQAIIIKTAADLISEDNPDYQYMAARLAIFHLRQLAYGNFDCLFIFLLKQFLVEGYLSSFSFQ